MHFVIWKQQWYYTAEICVHLFIINLADRQSLKFDQNMEENQGKLDSGGKGGEAPENEESPGENVRFGKYAQT